MERSSSKLDAKETLMFEHRCEGLKNACDYPASDVRIAKDDDGWVMHASYFDREDGTDSTFVPIKFCPFCREELDG